MTEIAISSVFHPPLWEQRRDFIINALRRDKTIKKVLDIGCGEGSLLQVLANSTQFSHLTGVDIDPLELKQCEYYCRPNERDKMHLRELPLTVDLYQG